LSVLGIGTDIVKIQRMQTAVQRSGRGFLEKIFVQRELEQARSCTDFVIYLATRFAGKEAIFKAFGTGWNTGVKLTEIEIANGKFGEPVVLLSGRFSELASQRNVEKVLLSVSYDTEYAIGFAVLLGRNQTGT